IDLAAHRLSKRCRIMPLTRFWNWLNHSVRRPACAPVMRRRYRPQIDVLEDRCLLAVLNVASLSGSAAVAGSLPAQVAAAANGDEIVFDPATFPSVTSPQTIALTASLAINKNLIISGPGPNLLTVSAAGFANAPVISIGAGNTVTISGLKFSGGHG